MECEGPVISLYASEVLMSPLEVRCMEAMSGAEDLSLVTAAAARVQKPEVRHLGSDEVCLLPVMLRLSVVRGLAPVGDEER